MDSNNSKVIKLPIFSVNRYAIWKFRVSSYLRSRHSRMWEVITKGPIVILEAVPLPAPEGYVRKAKNKELFESEERKQDELDSLARDIISGTVPDEYIEKIINCATAKEMWDILEKMCLGSDEINENRLSLACEKLESFTMKTGETIDEMELRFSQALGAVKSLKPTKYTQREINLKITRALPLADWHVYVVSQQNKPDFNEMSTEKLFSFLKANEFDILRNKNKLTHPEGTTEDQPQSSKGTALKATDPESKSPKDKVEARTDSQLVAQEVLGNFKVKEERMIKYVERI